jgi:HPt (histidine-containing phosphotransfer) domain-containing protein
VLLELLDSLVKGRHEEAQSSTPYDVAAELDDPALFAEVSQLFLTEMDRLIVAIDAAFADSDFKKLKDCVHSLKGSAAMVGANPMATICKEIEAAIANTSLEGVRQGLAKLHSEQPHAHEVFGKRPDATIAQAS